MFYLDVTSTRQIISKDLSIKFVLLWERKKLLISEITTDSWNQHCRNNDLWSAVELKASDIEIHQLYRDHEKMPL